MNGGSDDGAGFIKPPVDTENRFRSPALPLTALLFTSYLLLVFAAAFGVPVVLLIQWTIEAASAGHLSGKFLGYVWNSLSLSAVTATVAIICGIPLAYVACRRQTWASTLCVQGAYTGYVLPGPVAALAVLVLVLQIIPQLYGTVFVLLLAYLVHFLPAALQGMESTFQQLTPNLEEASRSLGIRSIRTFFSRDVSAGAWRISQRLDPGLCPMYEGVARVPLAPSRRVRYTRRQNLA